MKTIVKTFIILLICVMMIMPVSATYHDSGSDVGATGSFNIYDSWATPWVGVPRLLDGTWKIDGQIYYPHGPYHYQASGKTSWSAWRRMYGWTYHQHYIYGCKMTGGWYN